MKTFKEFLAEATSIVELTDPEFQKLNKRKQRDMVSKAWHRGVFYNGKDYFKMVYESNFDETIYRKYGERKSDVNAQESYSGYIPSSDTFIMGFDVWEANVWTGDEYGEKEPYLPSSVFEFKIEGGKAGAPKPLLEFDPGLMYPKIYKALHQKYKDLIDIRLD